MVMGPKHSIGFVSNPISNYVLNVNIGNYVHRHESYIGERGELDIDVYLLEENVEHMDRQFLEIRRMLRAFEYWFGPFPFYEDGYKLVEVPYLGMEHQSSITYGNGFQNGYRGNDLSESGWGLLFDFIIIHESGHEWFANNITYKDVADMWIHESFTNYSESLFLDYHYGNKASSEYCIGTRSRIMNDRPIIGEYGLNRRGSGDMYYKGGNMLHTLRYAVGDDQRFRSVLRGLNDAFYHQTVHSDEIESYIARKLDMKLNGFFDQYLRDIRIPRLVFNKDSKGFWMYKWENVVRNFKLPVKVYLDDRPNWIVPSDNYTSLNQQSENITVDPNWYIEFEIKE